MSHILINLKDGSQREFVETSRGGGSYHTSVKLELGWVTVTDAYEKRTSFPADEVAEVVETPSGGRF